MSDNLGYNPTTSSGAWTTSGTDQGMQTGQDLKEQAGEITRQAGQAAKDLMGQAGSQVKSQINSQKDNAAGTLGTVAEVLHTTGEQFREKDQAMIGEYADRIAGMIEDCSGYLRQRNVEDLALEAESFARQRPGIFLAGAVGLGFLAARFLKSSSSSMQAGSSIQRYDQGAQSSWNSGMSMGGSMGSMGSAGSMGSMGSSGMGRGSMGMGDGPVETASGRLYDGDADTDSPRGEPITSAGMTDDMDEGAEDYQYASESRGSNL